MAKAAIDLKHAAVEPHFTQVKIGGATVWFSYSVPVAVSTGYTILTRQNLWGARTERHIAQLDNGNKQVRLTTERFLDEVAVILKNGVAR